MKSSRRRQFERNTPEHPLTPLKLKTLSMVAGLELATPPQVASLTGLSLKAIRQHLRDLFDHGLLDKTSVQRSFFADADIAYTPEMQYGGKPADLQSDQSRL